MIKAVGVVVVKSWLGHDTRIPPQPSQAKADVPEQSSSQPELHISRLTAFINVMLKREPKKARVRVAEAPKRLRVEATAILRVMKCFTSEDPGFSDVSSPYISLTTIKTGSYNSRWIRKFR